MSFLLTCDRIPGMETESCTERLEKLRKVLRLLVPLVYAAVLSFSISDEWFPTDDQQQLAFVRDAESFWTILGADGFGLFRPIKNLLFLTFIRILPFVGVRGCRILGIAIGVLSFFPVLALCRRILGNEWKALLSASVWFLSPTLVSSVAWLSGVNIQLMVAFAALSLVFHDEAWTAVDSRFSRILLAGLFFFLSLVSYECAIALLPILFLFDCLLRPQRTKNRKVWESYAFYAVVAVVYLALRHAFNASTQVNGSFANVERWQIVVSSPFFTAEHFLSWFWPFGRFTVLGSYKWGDASWTVLALCAVIFVSAFAFAIAKRRQFSILSFCILLSLFAFAPVSNCLGLKNGPYGDYYLSLASIGLAAGCVELCALLVRTRGRGRIFAFAAVGAFAFVRLFAVPEAARWAIWWSRGNDAYEQSIANFPRFFSNKQMMSSLLCNAGRYEEALELGRQVEEAVGPDSFQMGGIYIIRMLYALRVEKDADAAFREIENSQRNGTFEYTKRLLHYYNGCIFEDLKDDPETAEKEYELSLSGKWTVDSVPCADRLARLKAIRGDLEDAIALWERAVRIDPYNATVWWNLSIAYRDYGDDVRASAAKEKVQRLMRR